MNYTIFVDESGDFEHSPRWIVSGVLCKGDPASAEKAIKGALYNVLKNYRLSSCRDLHLTELRENFGNAQAIVIAESAFNSVDNEDIVLSMLVVENSRKEGLRESERTYRMMLLDLLALADAALPESINKQQLGVVVARRQKMGELMSTRDELLADVVFKIQDAVEVGLAARGLLGRLDANHVQIKPAAESFGLAVSDFAANLSYNRDRIESRRLFNSLAERGKIRIFEGLGGYSERRARIAERDGDLVTSLARWSSISIAPNKFLEAEKAIKKIWKEILATRGTHGPEATIDSMLEKLWRQHKNDSDSYPDLLRKLMTVETIVVAENTSDEIIFRLRNFMHMLSNQVGDLEGADRIVTSKKQTIETIAKDPDKFNLILEHQVLRTVTEELRLDFQESLRVAREHVDLIEQYRTVWELLTNESGNSGFERSRLWVRARMTLLRSLLAVGDEGCLLEVHELIQKLKGQHIEDADLARLENYQVWEHIRNGDLTKGVDLAINILRIRNDVFSLQFAIRALADAVFNEVFHEQIKSIIPILRDRCQRLTGNPADLILRDMALIEFNLGRGKKAALRRLKESVKITESLPDSPLNKWKIYLSKVHIVTLEGIGEHDDVFLPKEALELIKKADSLSLESTPLQRYRRVSPC